MIEGKFTTSEAAKRAGIDQVTLQNWIAAGKLRGPKPILIGAVGYRLWSAKNGPTESALCRCRLTRTEGGWLAHQSEHSSAIRVSDSFHSSFLLSQNAEIHPPPARECGPMSGSFFYRPGGGKAGLGIRRQIALVPR